MQNRHSRENEQDGVTLRLYLLGPMKIECSGREIDLPSRKARALLAYLALRWRISVPRETITGLLWGDRGEEQARASLRQTLSAIRKSLGESSADILVSSNESVMLATQNIWVDAEQLKKAVDTKTGDNLTAAAELYRGEVLEGLTVGEYAFEQWLTAEREAFRSMACHLFEQASLRLEQEGRIEDAIKYCAKILALDSLQENVHCKIMRLFMNQKRYDAALNQFEQCKRELANQLDVSPGKEMTDLVAEIKKQRQRPGGQADAGNGRDVSNAQTKEPVTTMRTRQPLPDRPSIAVLPFTNMSADPEQAFFSEGISEDIITELSRFSELFVIARNSSFMFKDAAMDASEIGSKLGVRYLLEGSVRKAGKRIRVTAQLIDATTSEHIWADRYDRELVDIFEIQDDLTRSIVTTIKGRVDVDLARYASLKPTNNLSAYECVLKGQYLVHKYNEEDFAAARRLLKKAILLDPNYARAYGWLAYVDAQEWLYWQMSNENLSHAIKIGEQGLALDDNDSRCHLALGVSYLFKSEYEKAKHHFLKASLLNPNDDLVMVEFGRYKMYTDDPLEGAVLVRQGMRQNPFHPNWYWNVLARCLHTAKDFKGAISALEQIETVPFWSHAYFAACYTALGQPQKAKEHVDMALQLKPDLTLRKFETIFPYRNSKVRQEFLMDFKKAGFPE